MLTAIRKGAHIQCRVPEKKCADGLIQCHIMYSFSAFCATNNNKDCINFRCTEHAFITPKMHE
jgi:hypothetical protein